MNKVFLFLDTESTIFENERVVYDISISVIEQNENFSGTIYNKSLRSRSISSNGEMFTKLCEKNFIIYEYADLVPHSRKTMYGFANYRYANFSQVMNLFRIVCDYYKPDAIIGYNIQADFDAIKNTQSVLKTSECVYMKNSKLSSHSLFKQNTCKSFDNAYKTDLMLYLSNHCPNFMDKQEEFAMENKLFTNNGFISRKLIDMYRFATENPDIEQMHMGYYDNMYTIKCMEKAFKTDGIKYFPMNCMSENERKRKHSNEFTEIDDKVEIKYQINDLPLWFNDQLQNSKCLKNEKIEDIRKFHPDFGGSNKSNAPYFRGENSRAGIWPPNYTIF